MAVPLTELIGHPFLIVFGRVVLGFTLLASGVVKLRNPDKFVQTVIDYGSCLFAWPRSMDGLYHHWRWSPPSS
jgi:hypothetical protein